LLTIGRISFIHNDPAFYYLEKNPAEGIRLVSAPPRELLSMIVSEKVDFAPISSVTIPQHSDLTIVPVLSVHSEGKALSAILMGRKGERRELRPGDRIAVTRHTETSMRMLEVLLRKRNIGAEFVNSNDASSDLLLEQAPFALVIGNEALAAAATNDDRIIFDLGEEWWNATGKSAVFAVSVMRRSFLAEKGGDADRIIELIKKSLKYGYENLEKVVSQAARKSDLPTSLLRDYFARLRLDYTQQAAEGYERLIDAIS
jgi:chorismate dehydratase